MARATRSDAATTRRSRLALEGIAAVLASAGTVLAGVGLMAVAGLLVMRAAGRPPILDLFVLVVAVRALGLARPVLRYAERLVSHDLTFRVLLAVRRWVVDALVRTGRVRALGHRHGDVLSRVAGDIERLQDAVLRVHLPMATAALVAGVVVAGLGLFDVRLAAAVGGLMLLYGGVWPWISLRWMAGRGQARRTTRAAMSADLVGTLQGLGDLVAFGAAPAATRGLARHQAALDAIERRLGWMAALDAGVGVLLSAGALWLVLRMRLPDVGAGTIDGVLLGALAFAIGAAFEALDPLPGAWQAREEVAAAAQRVGEIVEAHVQTASPRVDATAAPAPAPSGPPEVRLEGVSVAGDGRAILRDVTLVIRPGARLAVCGPTGAGKTTLLLTIEGVMAPTKGRVLVGGRDLAAVPESAQYRPFAVLPQSVHLFNRTLRENVAVARAGASDAELLDALGRAGLGRWVEGLPLGLDTLVGELGTRLSGGERQRVGLARVFVSGAPILLLDEPTAHLDVGTERTVLEALDRWAGERTIVMATHRPVAARWTTLELAAEPEVGP